jgi:outer membrane lipoprotein LolB
MSCARLLLGALATALLASGCATTPREAPGGQRAADPAELTQWTARGRLALVARGEGGSGSFAWDQRSDRTELALRGPLGAGGLQLVSDGDTFELTDSSGRPLDGEAARSELERRLGARLPLAELRYWLLGVPAPRHGGGDPVQLATGAVPGFVQGGWVVSFEEFKPQGSWTLPVRLTATTSGVRVRIVVDDWILPTP